MSESIKVYPKNKSSKKKKEEIEKKKKEKQIYIYVGKCLGLKMFKLLYFNLLCGN